MGENLRPTQERMATVMLAATADKNGLQSGQDLRTIVNALGITLQNPGRTLHSLWNQSNTNRGEESRTIKTSGNGSLTIYVDAGLHRMKIVGTGWVAEKMSSFNLSSDYFKFGNQRRPRTPRSSGNRRRVAAVISITPEPRQPAAVVSVGATRSSAPRLAAHRPRRTGIDAKKLLVHITVIVIIVLVIALGGSLLAGWLLFPGR